MTHSSEYVSPGVHRWGWASAVGDDGAQIVAVAPLRRSRIANGCSRLLHRSRTGVLVGAAAAVFGLCGGAVTWSVAGLPGVLIAGIPFTVAGAALMYVLKLTAGDDELQVSVDGTADCEALRTAAGSALTDEWSDAVHDQVFRAAVRLKRALTAHSPHEQANDGREDN